MSTDDFYVPEGYQDPRERAERGALWFDSVYPEWFSHIETSELDLADSCKCVWGQVNAVDYDDGIQIFNGSLGTATTGYSLATKVLGVFGVGNHWFIDHGFLPNEFWGYADNPIDENVSDAAMLDDAWLDLITERQYWAAQGA